MTNDRVRLELGKFVSRLEARIDHLEKISNRFSSIRLIFVLGGIVATYFAFEYWSTGSGWLVLFAATVCFYILVKLHSRVVYSIRKHKYYAEIKAGHIARMDRDWERIPEPIQAGVAAKHSFAIDLDILGARSLHHLIDTSFTREGSDLLAGWLTTESPERDTIVERQDCVRELVPFSAFRDRLSVLSGLVTRDPTDKWDGKMLLRWLESHIDRGRMLPVLAILIGLAVLTAVLVVLRFSVGIGNWWVLSLTAYASIYLINFRLYSHLFDEAEHLYFELNRFRPVLAFMERYKFPAGSKLQGLIAPLQDGERRPTSYLRKALWLSIAASAQKNEVVRIIFNAIFPWDLYFAYRLSAYKTNLRDRLPAWLNTVNSFEALGSLANFSAINRHVTFPQLRPSGSGGNATSTLVCKDLGHPLLQVGHRVANDFDLSGAGQIALVTGSNMSGKSTFLRTVGTNMSLAQAGGPVDASSLSCSLSRLFTCINVSDSVNDGISYFYAEVRRLKLLLDLIESDGLPVLFLVDEIFRGTNNRERYVGSRSLLLSLGETNAMGLVSTHDLDLVALEDEDAAHVTNYHFREHIENGKMVFDYLLRPGPSPTTNALGIMELEGLPVKAL